ncbi:MAG: AAA family ATPase [Phaeodactylibacter sp.]|nr:AAA family ATPase [Phaeodactylibacter sp.]MCB9303835.1 AAA family ATPase [Lewinellaceae bacterium]
MPVKRIEANLNFLSRSGPVLCIYGQVNDDFIAPSDYIPKNLEWILAEYLRNNGYDCVVFYSSKQGLYALDVQSKLFCQADGASQIDSRVSSSSPDDRRPLGSLNLYLPEPEAADTGASEDEPLTEEEKPPFIIAKGHFSAFATMEAIMTRRKVRTAVVIPHFDEIRIGGEVENQWQDILRNWIKLPSVSRNKCIIVFNNGSADEILQALEERGYNQLYEYLSGKLNRRQGGLLNEMLSISIPEEDEIRRLLHRRRLLESLPLHWKKLDRIIHKLRVKGLTLRELALEPLPEADAQTPMEELMSMIGLKKVKELIQDRLDAARFFRDNPGVSSIKNSRRHLIFTGNPGTGKTTVAKLVGQIYKEAGLLKTGNVIPVSQQDLVADHLGGTAKATAAWCERALGGILFIDEAYALFRNEQDSFGRQAIDVLNQYMEEKRDDLMVILAGYQDEMQQLFEANPGFRSRFPHLIEFEDYTPEELYQIFELKLKVSGLNANEVLLKQVETVLQNFHFRRGKHFGNAREVDTLFEGIVERNRARLGRSGDPNVTELSPIDLPENYTQFLSFGFDEDALSEAMEELNSMVGLQQVKDLIQEIIKENKFELLSARNKSRKESQFKRNFVFAGNPGTGKTTVAKLMGRICKALGMIPTDKVKNVSRSDLVAGYVGQTAEKTRKVVEDARDGVLFIDEAYSLVQGGMNDFGPEAVKELVNQMTVYQQRLVVIVAGYPGEMEYFLTSDPGLQSRFNMTLHFEDYNAEQLYTIFENLARKEQMDISPEAQGKVRPYFEAICRNAVRGFGNAREVQRFFNEVYQKFKSRVIQPLARGEAIAYCFLPEDIPAYGKLKGTIPGQNLPSARVMASRYISDAGRSMAVGLRPALPTRKQFQAPPRVYLAFAHDKNTPLPELHQEYQDLSRLLRPLDKNGAIRMLVNEYTETDTIFEQFNLFKDEICLFHYGGHADGQGLHLNSSSGNNEKAYAEGLARLFAQSLKLQCVFLNGCATIEQVETLLEAGVKAVIATQAPVGDKKAALFAKAFYEVLVGGSPLQEAFEAGRARVGASYPEFQINQEAYRGVILAEESQDFPWGLFYQDETVLNWSLPTHSNYLAKDLTQLPAYATGQLLGRSQELEQIHDYLGKKELPMLIRGMGGIGKSSLAKAYLRKYYDQFNHIAWIDGQEGARAGFLKEKRLIHCLGLEEDFQKYRDNSQLFELIMTRLRDVEGSGLLILDDPKDMMFEELEALPKPPNWSILITSRHQIQNCEVLQLGQLPQQPAEMLFRKHFHREEVDSEALSRLFALIDYHPLVIELLAKTLQNNFNLEGVESLITPLSQPAWDSKPLGVNVDLSFADGEKQILQHLHSIFSLANDSKGGTGMTDHQLDILRKFSALPAQFIHGKILQELIAVSKQHQNSFINDLTALVNRGWLENNGQAHFRMHPLIQVMCLGQLEPSLEDCASIISGVTDRLEFDPFTDRFLDKIMWSSFAERLLKLFGWKEEQMTNLAIHLCALLNEGGNHQRVISLLQKPLAYYLETAGQDDPTTVTIQMQLGIAYRNLGKLKESKELMERSAEVFSNLLDSEEVRGTPEMLIFFKEHLGITQYMNGEYDQAKQFMESALELYQKHYSDSGATQQIFQWKILLCHIYRELGDDDKAIETGRTTREEILLTTGAEQNPFVARINIALALALLEKGNELEASELLEDANQILLEQYGEGHYELTAIQSVLCLFYLDKGKVESSLEQLTKIADAIEARYGKLHPQYAECRLFIGLGKSYKATLLENDPEAATALTWEGLENIGEAMHIFHETTGQDTLYQSTSPTQMGLMAMNTDSPPEKVESLLAETYQQNLERYGTQHLNTLDSHFGLLFFRIINKNDLEALPLCEQTLAEFAQIADSDNMDTGLYTILLSYCHKYAGNFNRAKEVFEEGRERINSAMGYNKWGDTLVNMLQAGFQAIEPF